MSRHVNWNLAHSKGSARCTGSEGRLCSIFWEGNWPKQECQFSNSKALMDNIEITLIYVFLYNTSLWGGWLWFVFFLLFFENYSHSAVTARTLRVLTIFHLNCNKSPFSGRTKQPELPLTTLDFRFTPFSCRVTFKLGFEACAQLSISKF